MTPTHLRHPGMTKKVVRIALALVFVIALTACGVPRPSLDHVPIAGAQRLPEIALTSQNGISVDFQL